MARARSAAQSTPSKKAWPRTRRAPPAMCPKRAEGFVVQSRLMRSRAGRVMVILACDDDDVAWDEDAEEA